MIYGAYGYTGDLCARRAIELGMTPVLAGRNADRVGALAAELGLPHLAFSLDDPAAVRDALADAQVVLHCAGPFSSTYAPMIEACIDTKTHYLDVTGELQVLEGVYALHERIAAASITAIPAIGFDVVPTDCVAATLVARLPDATSLELAFTSDGRPSRGTMKSTVEGLAAPGMIRKGGVLTVVPAAWRTKTIEFSVGKRACVSIPWGDVSSAYRSTGIGDIVVYMSMPPATIRSLRLARPLLKLAGTGPMQRLLKGQVERRGTNPSADERAAATSEIWGRVEAADGRAVETRLTTPNGYVLTANSAVEAVRRLLAGGIPSGGQTPSSAFGADYAVSLPGIREIGASAVD